MFAGIVQAVDGVPDGTIMIVFGVIFIILSLISILIGMNQSKKFVSAGNFQDDYIDEDEYKIYQAKIARAEKEVKKIDK